MDRIYQTLTDPVALLVIGISTIVLNIISNILHKRVERQLATFSEGRREKLRQRTAKREMFIQQMVSEEEMLRYNLYRGQRLWSWVLLFAILLVLFTQFLSLRMIRDDVFSEALTAATAVVTLMLWAMLATAFRAATRLDQDIRRAIQIRREKRRPLSE